MRKIIFSKKTIFFLIAGLLLFLPSLSIAQVTQTAKTEDLNLSDAFGQPLENVGKAANYNVTSPSLEYRISLMMNLMFALLGVIFIIFIVYSGYLWATASGNEEKVKKAKDNIYRTVIGLIIVVGAYAIAQFVLNVLLK